jgi:hypothetical protein
MVTCPFRVILVEVAMADSIQKVLHDKIVMQKIEVVKWEES